MTDSLLYKIFEQTCFNRYFEYNVAKYHDMKYIRPPVYLSLGQEHIPATLAQLIDPEKWLIFPQHRCHSYLLSFGTPPKLVIEELLGVEGGLHGGTCGSASLDYKNIFGHSGLLGDQVPIAVGAAHASNKNVLCILGDGAAEEDYVLGAFGFAATKKVPILFICEDNNLSVLTEKKVRRSWDLTSVAKSLGLYSCCCNDYPETIYDIVSEVLQQNRFKENKLPACITINTCRHMWHAGTGSDGPPKWNTYEKMKQEIPNSKKIENKVRIEVEKLWQTSLKQLKK